MKDVSNFDELTVAWLAGLLEGEGYFGTVDNRVSGRCYRYPRIGISMTDEDVIQRVSDLWGTKRQVVKPSGAWRGPNPKPMHRVYLFGKRAAALMEDLYPYMGERRRTQIDNVLEEYRLKDDPNERRRIASALSAKARRRDSRGQFIEAGGNQ